MVSIFGFLYQWEMVIPLVNGRCLTGDIVVCTSMHLHTDIHSDMHLSSTLSQTIASISSLLTCSCRNAPRLLGKVAWLHQSRINPSDCSCTGRVPWRFISTVVCVSWSDWHAKYSSQRVHCCWEAGLFASKDAFAQVTLQQTFQNF